MKNLGAWLIIAFGCLLTVGDLGAGGAQVGGGTCGGPIVIGSVFCPQGALSVTKTVVGTGTAPAGGWTVTLGSTNCSAGLAGRQDLVATIPSGGGVATFNGLFISTVSGLNAPSCLYTLTESAVTDWTPSFAPAGPYTVSASQTTNVALTNTATPATTTTAPATTTTTIAASTTTVLPTTTAPPTSAAVQPVTPTTPTAVALPATGSRASRPTFYIGLGFILIGTLILFSRRRSNQPTAN